MNKNDGHNDTDYETSHGEDVQILNWISDDKRGRTISVTGSNSNSKYDGQTAGAENGIEIETRIMDYQTSIPSLPEIMKCKTYNGEEANGPEIMMSRQ